MTRRFETEVSNDAADYTTAHKIHAFVFALLTRDLPRIHDSAPITRVSVRFGFFADGSYTVAAEDEPAADDALEEI